MQISTVRTTYAGEIECAAVKWATEIFANPFYIIVKLDVRVIPLFAFVLGLRRC